MRISLHVGGSVAISSGIRFATKSRASVSSSCQVRVARISLCQLIGSPSGVARCTLMAALDQGSPGGASRSVRRLLRDVGPGPRPRVEAERHDVQNLSDESRPGAQVIAAYLVSTKSPWTTT